MERETEASETLRAAKQEMLAALCSRKDALEAKLQEKNEELKMLCLEEYELTGILPAEMPLEPGQSPPPLRRRVGTSYTLPENLINRLNSKKEESIAGLELEYEIQRRITTAAFQLFNNCSGNNSVKRERKMQYKKNQDRLEELKKQLEKMHQNVGTNLKGQKQRKKPRPPLGAEVPADESGHDAERDPILQDEGISLSPISQIPVSVYQQHESSRQYWETYNHYAQLLENKVVASQEPVNHKIHQYNSFTMPLKQHSHSHQIPYSQIQRYGSTGYFPFYQHPQYIGYALHFHEENERLNRVESGQVIAPYWSKYDLGGTDCLPTQATQGPYNHVQGHPSEVFHSVDELDGETEPDLPSRHSSLEGRSSRWNRDRFGSLDRRKHTAHSSPCLESRSVDDLDALQGSMEEAPANIQYVGYHSRENVLYVREKRRDPNVTVGSSTRKHAQNPSHSINWGGDTEDTHRYQQVYNNNVSTCQPSAQFANTLGGALLPGQTYPEHSLGHVTAASVDRGLLRAQSLGSVETATHSNTDSRSIKDSLRGNDVHSSGSFSQHKPQETSNRKQKEKEWYETSLDSPTPSHRSHSSSRRPSGHSLSEVKSHSSNENPSSHPPPSDNVNNLPVSNSPRFHSECSTVNSSPKANSPDQHFLQAKSDTANELFDTVVPFESPKNHMVIQAGKWQPYWEVTKPFEMSDFYKYSTKFRKKNNQVQNASGDADSSNPGMQSSSGNGAKNFGTSLGTDSRTTSNSPQFIPKSSDDVSQCSEVASRTIMVPSPTPSMSPQQKGIYQPLQPMTCQPLESSAESCSASVRLSTPSPSKSCPQNRSRVVSPNASLDGSLTLGTGESLADAFSTEMLAWYQDQSVPRSATLV